MQVRISSGTILGTHEGGMAAFKGIPFAQAPVGPLRFKPPQRALPWEGVLNCQHDGPRPIQNPPPWSKNAEAFAYSEDCLNLNVWTPAADSKKRPVVVNIYGGGHMEGSNSELGREGHRLANGRDIVVVAPNYRVGPLGYLYLGQHLGEEYAASGSLGLLDQIMALEWVRDNIAFLGGDPNNVTLIGQSAGGKSVSCLLAAPGAAGLFHRAVAMSGSLQCVTDIKTDIALTEQFLQGMPNPDPKYLLSCPTSELLHAMEQAGLSHLKAESYGPTADGITLPKDVTDHIRHGGIDGVSVIMGHTLQELWLDPTIPQPEPSSAELRRRMAWKFGNNQAHVYEKYLALRAQTDFPTAYGTIMTSYTYVQAYMRIASLLADLDAKLWLFRWDYKGGLIANHSSDNEALHGDTNAQKIAWNPEQTAQVDRQYQTMILDFVETGDPGWPPCTKEQPLRMHIDAPCHLEPIDLDQYDHEFPLQVMVLD